MKVDIIKNARPILTALCISASFICATREFICPIIITYQYAKIVSYIKRIFNITRGQKVIKKILIILKSAYNIYKTQEKFKVSVDK